jgi:hypothetical protein
MMRQGRGHCRDHGRFGQNKKRTWGELKGPWLHLLTRIPNAASERLLLALFRPW